MLDSTLGPGLSPRHLVAVGIMTRAGEVLGHTVAPPAGKTQKLDSGARRSKRPLMTPKRNQRLPGSSVTVTGNRRRDTDAHITLKCEAIGWSHFTRSARLFGVVP